MAESRSPRRHPDHFAHDLPDTPASDIQIRKAFNISAATLARKRKLSGFPQPDFYLDRRGYTWWSRVVAWTQVQSKTSPIAGRMVGRDTSEAA